MSEKDGVQHVANFGMSARSETPVPTGVSRTGANAWFTLHSRTCLLRVFAKLNCLPIGRSRRGDLLACLAGEAPNDQGKIDATDYRRDIPMPIKSAILNSPFPPLQPPPSPTYDTPSPTN